MKPRAARILFLLAVLAGLLALGYRLRAILNPVLLGALLAYILNPAVSFLERKGVKRIFATTILFAALFGGTAALFLAVVPALFREVAALPDHAVKAKAWVEAKLEELPDPAAKLQEVQKMLGEFGFLPFTDEGRPPVPRDAAAAQIPPPPTSVRPLQDLEDRLDLPRSDLRRRPLAKDAADRIVRELEARSAKSPEDARLQGALAQARSLRRAVSERLLYDEALARIEALIAGNVNGVLDRALSILTTTQAGIRSGLGALFTLFGYGLLVPIYTFFLLQEFSRLARAVRDNLPGRHRERILSVASKIDLAASAFFRGRVVICLVKGALTFVGLLLCHVPFSFLLGVLAGVGALIPFAAFLTAFAPAVLLSYFDSGWALLPYIVGVFLLVEVIEGVLLTPFYLGRQVSLHPVTLLFTLFVGGELLGLYGVLLAVPLGCAAKILFLEFVWPEVQALAREDSAKAGGG